MKNKSSLINMLVSLAFAAMGVWLVSCDFHVKPSPWEKAGIPETDWKDDKVWRGKAKCKAVERELIVIVNAAEARGGPTPDETETVIEYMHSPHYDTRETALIVAGAARSDPARAVLLPHVLGLLSDPVWTVRLWAAWSLGKMGDKSVIPYLEPLLKDRPAVAKVAQKAILKLQGEETAPEK